MTVAATEEVHIALRATCQRVIARAAIESVTAITTEQGVVAGQTRIRVVTCGADDDVVPTIQADEAVIACATDVLCGVEFGSVPLGAVGKFN